MEALFGNECPRHQVAFAFCWPLTLGDWCQCLPGACSNARQVQCAWTRDSSLEQEAQVGLNAGRGSSSIVTRACASTCKYCVQERIAPLSNGSTRFSWTLLTLGHRSSHFLNPRAPIAVA
eukprot:6477487-Amphidinium_carterae.1